MTLFPALLVSTLSLAMHASTTSKPATADALLAISNGTYLAFQHKDGQAMQALTTRDFTYIGPEGVLTGPQLGAATKGCDLRSFNLGAAQLKTIDDKTAVLTYTAEQDMQCDGHAAPPRLVNMDLFVRRHGTWLVSAHMETPTSAKP